MSLTASVFSRRTDDAEMRAFLITRLEEDRDAARRRQGSVRGLDLLEEVLAQLCAGETPDQMTCDLLLVAYGSHADFREQWNRWRPDATGYLGEAI